MPSRAPYPGHRRRGAWTSLVTSTVLLVLVLLACSEAPKRRPLGATCGSPDQCESGICAENLCVDPLSCARALAEQGDSAFAAACSAALHSPAIAPDPLQVEPGGTLTLTVTARLASTTGQVVVGDVPSAGNPPPIVDLTATARFASSSPELLTFDAARPGRLSVAAGAAGPHVVSATVGQAPRELRVEVNLLVGDYEGTCTAAGVCSCDAGWGGALCADPLCTPACVEGACVAPDECSCDAGWGGALCSVPICAPSCVHGDCVAPDECTCDEGFTGSACDVPSGGPIACEDDGDCPGGDSSSPTRSVCDPELDVCVPACAGWEAVPFATLTGDYELTDPSSCPTCPGPFTGLTALATELPLEGATALAIDGGSAGATRCEWRVFGDGCGLTRGAMGVGGSSGTFAVTVPLFCGRNAVQLICANEHGSRVVGRELANAVCERDLRVTLTWDDQGLDLELHLVRDGGVINSLSDDCTWNTCRSSGGLDWGVPGELSDNPRKDVDATSTFGPENIYLDAAPPGIYHILVEHWSPSGQPSEAAVAVTIRERTIARVTTVRLPSHWVWYVGTVTFPGGTFTPVDERSDCTGSWDTGNRGCLLPLP